MQVAIDNLLYEKIADAFVDEFLFFFVRDLHNSPLVAFDVFDKPEEKTDLIFTIAFNSLVLFETPRKLPVGAEEYVAHVSFATNASRPDRLVGSSKRSDLHGSVEEEAILKAIAAVKADLENN